MGKGKFEFFTNEDLKSLETLRQAYRLAALHNHPDKHDDSESEIWTALFKSLQAEYESILSSRSRAQWKKEKSSYGLEKTLQEMIDKAMKIPGIHIELCGSWLWISGNTFMARARLKMAGFKFSKTKQRWYWGMTMVSKRKKARYRNMASIYSRYGRETLGDSDSDEPLLIGM